MDTVDNVVILFHIFAHSWRSEPDSQLQFITQFSVVSVRLLPLSSVLLGILIFILYIFLFYCTDFSVGIVIANGPTPRPSKL